MKHTSLKAKLALIQTCSIACRNNINIHLLNNIFRFVENYNISYGIIYTRENMLAGYMRRYYIFYKSRLSVNDYIALVRADEILYKTKLAKYILEV